MCSIRFYVVAYDGIDPHTGRERAAGAPPAAPEPTLKQSQPSSKPRRFHRHGRRRRR